MLQDDLFKPYHYLPFGEFRELTLQRLQKFCDQRFFSTADYLADPLKFQAGLEVLSFAGMRTILRSCAWILQLPALQRTIANVSVYDSADYSLAIKAGVHFTLCGGTIMKLGTARQHQKYVDKLDSLELPGCFGMTELGHGSNVMVRSAHHNRSAP